MRTSLVALAALSCMLPAAALAEEAAAPLEDQAALKLNEVEHGLYLGMEAGGLFLFSPAAAKDTGGFTPGRTFTFTLGGDIGDFLSLGLLVMASNMSTPSGFTSDGPSGMRGSFSALTLGAMAKISPFGFKDSNDVKRAYVYARAGAGYALIGPKDFYKDGDVMVLAGVGLEYFTHLRHFSLGLTADFVYGVSHLGPGVMVTPNLRYTF